MDRFVLIECAVPKSQNLASTASTRYGYVRKTYIRYLRWIMDSTRRLSTCSLHVDLLDSYMYRTVPQSGLHISTHRWLHRFNYKCAGRHSTCTTLRAESTLGIGFPNTTECKVYHRHCAILGLDKLSSTMKANKLLYSREQFRI